MDPSKCSPKIPRSIAYSCGDSDLVKGQRLWARGGVGSGTERRRKKDRAFLLLLQVSFISGLMRATPIPQCV